MSSHYIIPSRNAHYIRRDLTYSGSSTETLATRRYAITLANSSSSSYPGGEYCCVGHVQARSSGPSTYRSGQVRLGSDSALFLSDLHTCTLLCTIAVLPYVPMSSLTRFRLGVANLLCANYCVGSF